MSSEKKCVSLKSSDGLLVSVDEAVALESKTIANSLDFMSSDTPITLPNVTGHVLNKVFEYCQRHVEARQSHVDDLAVFDKLAESPPLTDWDADFVKKLDHDGLLFDIILAANYLEIKGLLDLTCKCVADMLKGSVEDIRKKFNIKNDYTSEEEREFRKENAWAFD